MALGGDAQTQMMMGVTRQRIIESSASVEGAARTHSGYSTCAGCGSNIHTKKRLWTDPKNVGTVTVQQLRESLGRNEPDSPCPVRRDWGLS